MELKGGLVSLYTTSYYVNPNPYNGIESQHPPLTSNYLVLENPYNGIESYFLFIPPMSSQGGNPYNGIESLRSCSRTSAFNL